VGSEQLVDAAEAFAWRQLISSTPLMACIPTAPWQFRMDASEGSRFTDQPRCAASPQASHWAYPALGQCFRTRRIYGKTTRNAWLAPVTFSDGLTRPYISGLKCRGFTAHLMVNCYLDMRIVLGHPQGRLQMQSGRKTEESCSFEAVSKKLRVKNAGCHENAVDEPAEF
jgi:hypothetical protein